MMQDCAIIQADREGYANCPYCNARLRGRYPSGAENIYLICRWKRCPSGGKEMHLNILAASDRASSAH